VLAAMRLVLAEPALQHRLRNTGHLLTGSGANLILSIPTIALTARGLGPEGYGILALVLSYVQATKRFADFQIWQPLIRYGAHLDARADAQRLGGLYKYGLMVDAAASLVSWTLAAVGALVAHFFFGMSNMLLVASLIYSVVLLFNISGTPVAILRLNGRFRDIAYNQLSASILKLALSAVAYGFDGGLLAFVIVWAVTDVLAAILLIAAAFRVLRQQDLHRLDRARIGDATCDMPGLVRFTWSSNLSLTLWSTTQQLDTLLVGAMTNPTTAGLYYLVKRITRAVQQGGQQFQAVVYPEMVRLFAAEDHRAFNRVVRQTIWILALYGAGMFVGCAIFGRFVLTLIAGPAFGSAWLLLTVHMAALALTICGTVMRSALLAMGEPKLVLRTVLLSVLIFYAVAVQAIPHNGAFGAVAAHLALGASWLILLGYGFRRKMAPLRR
jgi:O-antigen/teichoic acid export membrane protein